MEYHEIKLIYPYLEHRILKSIKRVNQRIGMITFGAQLGIFQERKKIISRNDREFVFSQRLYLLILPKTLGFVKTIALAMAYCKYDKPTATNQRSRIYCLETSYGAGFLDLPDYTGTSPPKIQPIYLQESYQPMKSFLSKIKILEKEIRC